MTWQFSTGVEGSWRNWAFNVIGAFDEDRDALGLAWDRIAGNSGTASARRMGGGLRSSEN